MSQKISSISWFWERLEKHLNAKQLKQTKQRKLIIECFLHLGKHVSAEELYQLIRSKKHNIGLATIYRTLNLLKEAKLVDQNTFGDGRSTFELNQPGYHHDHLFCVKCDHYVEFKDDVIEKRQELLAKTNGFHLISHSHNLYGICQECSKGSNRT